MHAPHSCCAVWNWNDYTSKGNFFYNETTGTKRGRNRAVALTSGTTKTGFDFDITSAVSYTLSGTISGLTETDNNLIVTVTAWAG